MSDPIETLAARHGFSVAAAQALAEAMRRGGSRQAQFSHPELGGMGQWSQGGMLMIGTMNDHALKARVGALAQDLAARDGQEEVARKEDRPVREPSSGSGTGGGWPTDLGHPSASGSQNGMRYAVFPERHRLAVERDGRTTLHDTLDHRIHGASQSQGGFTQLRFASQHGDVDLESLPQVER